MSTAAESTGRSRTVLVFGSDSNARAVISSVVAHIKEYADNERISFTGPVAFEKSTVEHISDVLIPIVDKIQELLGLDKKSFDISVVNPGGVSVSDLGAKVTGFSADVPVVLAMLSAALNIGMADDIVSTGHIASCDGDIAAVKAMAAKISSAFEDKFITHFIYPSLDKDRSLAVLSPIERQEVEAAVINAKDRLKMTAVSNIFDIVQAVFTDENIVTSSLQEGFFGINGLQNLADNPVLSAAGLLAMDNDKRFWIVLERYFHAGDSKNAKRLLLAYLQFHVRNKKYPKEFGRQLIQLLRSLPAGTRKTRIGFPVLPTLECVKLTQFAGNGDSEDIGLLYNAAQGKDIWMEPARITRPKPAGDLPEDDKEQALIDSIVSRIDSAALTKNIGVPIDTARATYMLDSLTVGSNEQFYDVVSRYYLHLQRHMHSVSESVDLNRLRDDAVALVERTFADKGGITAATNEACDAIHGGMKFILDCITEQFRIECRSRYTNRIIRETLGPLDRQAQASFISGLLKRLAAHLPAEIAAASPERFVDHYETIAKEYVQSLDKINETFRRF